MLDSKGEIQTGIGVTSARPMHGAASTPFDAFRRIARADRGRGVWSAYVNRYEESRFDLEGREELRVVRDAGWFQAYDDELPGEMISVPSRPRVEALLEAADRLLWVLVSVADREFEPLRPPTASSEGEFPVAAADIDFNRLLDTTVEVIDLELGTVLARRTFDAYLRFVSTPNDDVLLYSVREDEWLDLVCDVMAGTVVGASR
ncbi:MAG TPA: hypothetical protein VE173_10525 [Longimicrobiales bacterium]|nr:hypothetical protein [Longimicrobiales bacterium]